MSILKNEIKSFPKTAGVYQFVNENREILYVGKAKNLQQRLKSYFAKEVRRGPTIDVMMKEAKEIKYIETESEIEAVILEADLISKISPKYNIRQKDDKSFLVIRISKEDFPQISLVRFRNVDFTDKSAEYFGPYPVGDLLKRSLRYLRKIMPFRDCSTTKYKSHLKKKKNCLFGDIGLCEAPCQNIETKERYQNNIRMLKEFLRGRKQNVYKNLQKEMKRLSREKRYEEAKIFRDRLNALEHIKDVAIGLSDDVVKPENILFKRIECYDISNISGQFCVGSMIVFINGKPEKSEYRKFKIKGRRLTVNGNEARIVESQTLDVTASRCKFRNRSTLPTNGDSLRSDIQMMEQVLDRRFNNDWAPPDLIIIDGGIAHLNIAKHVLDKYKQDVPILAIAKGPKRRKNEFHFSNQVLAQYFHKNPDLQRIAIRARNEAHRFAVTYYRKLHHKNMLNVT